MSGIDVHTSRRIADIDFPSDLSRVLPCWNSDRILTGHANGEIRLVDLSALSSIPLGQLRQDHAVDWMETDATHRSLLTTSGRRIDRGKLQEHHVALWSLSEELLTTPLNALASPRASVLRQKLWIGIPLLLFPVWAVLSFYLLRNIVLGYTFFFLNAPSHYPAEADCLACPEQNDFVYRQTATTLNYRVGWLGRALCSGVEFQIEHHLFPSICHTQLPKVSPFVKEFCEYHGYPYRTLGWGESLLKSLRAFVVPKAVVEPSARKVPCRHGPAHQ